jgi:hypothetical protein
MKKKYVKKNSEILEKIIKELKDADEKTPSPVTIATMATTTLDESYLKVKSLIVGRTYNATNWIHLVSLCMEVVKPNNRPGTHEMVENLMVKLIREVPMEEDADRSVVQSIVSCVLPVMMKFQVGINEMVVKLAGEFRPRAFSMSSSNFDFAPVNTNEPCQGMMMHIDGTTTKTTDWMKGACPNTPL